MSELKIYKRSDILQGHWFTEYCRKDDADKVIALLTDKANYNEYAYKLKSEELADTCRFYEDEIRRQKHKRCLRNAEGCKNKAWFYGEVHDRNAALTMWKWRKRWLELAEQFKDKEA